MPLVRDIKIELNLDEVLRRQEVLKPERMQPRMMALIQELLGIVPELVEPAYIYEYYSIKEAADGHIVLETGDVFTSPDMVDVLTRAQEMTAVLCTIGHRLENTVQEFFASGESLRGILLDGIGSAAIDCVSNSACQRIGNEAAARGLTSSSPISPGMGRIPIEEQRRLFHLVPAEQLGARITATNMIIPRKSVSMFIGIGKDMARWHPVEVCEKCKLRDTCTHRRRA